MIDSSTRATAVPRAESEPVSPLYQLMVSAAVPATSVVAAPSGVVPTRIGGWSQKLSPAVTADAATSGPLASAPIEAIAGMRPSDARLLKKMFCAKTIGELGSNKYIVAAVAIAVNTRWRELWEARMADPLTDAETLQIDATGNVTDIGKRPTTYAQIQGQYMGLIKFSHEAVPRVLGFYDRLDRSVRYDGKDFDNMYMTSFLQSITDHLEPVRAVPVDGGWMEIDSHEDLELAEHRGAEFLA